MKNVTKGGIAAAIVGGIAATIAVVGGALAQRADSNKAEAETDFDNAIDQYNANNTDSTYTETTAPAAEPAQPEGEKD